MLLQPEEQLDALLQATPVFQQSLLLPSLYCPLSEHLQMCIRDRYDAENGVLHIHMGSLSGVNEEVSAMGIKIWMQDDQSDLSWVDFSEQDENGVYHADVDLSPYDYMSGNYHIQAVLTYTSGTEYLLGDELNVSIE